MAKPTNNFKKLAGVPVHYDRLSPPNDYGTRGKVTNFHVTKEFQKNLSECFKELWEICPFGPADVITSAGAYTAKPGFHGMGKAFDLDGIFWENKTFITLRYPSDPKFYLGINSVLRKHFGTVLDYHYNSSHRDHFHIQDDGKVVGFRKIRSIIVFLQAVISEVFNDIVEIDGRYGPKTDAALGRVLEKLNIDGDLSEKENWLIFLTKISEKAFGTSGRVVSEEASTPLELLDELYRIINEELVDFESRKVIETTLDQFAAHEETENWLNKFRE
ncbi:extensin family protein [uncultured Ilyobacter sp.]|uniref:extensin family protein n=1 Tax=uncultured Ilyobacter sp. TaxID=544433 RepID=UPI0029F51DE4|nr:extensin family protein [uncultured Ilyobacter sp.]